MGIRQEQDCGRWLATMLLAGDPYPPALGGDELPDWDPAGAGLREEHL